MKLNINDPSRLQDLKKSLVENNVSANAINSIEKAIRNGFEFKKSADLNILNLPESDIRIIGEVVSFNPASSANSVRTFQFTFKPVGDEKLFFGYQFLITYTDRNNFTIAETYPIEDLRIVYVDLDMDDILNGTKLNLQVKSAIGEFCKIILSNTGEPNEELIEVAKTSLANAVIQVKIANIPTIENPSVNNSYQVKGKLISSMDDKMDGYQVVLYAAVQNSPDGSADFIPVAFASTETNGYFVTSFLVFNDAADIFKVTQAKAIVSKDDKEYEIPVKLHTETDSAGGDAIIKTMIPRRLILVISQEVSEDEKECECAGCNDLNFHEKKVFEEYNYYTVVRTTEPSIIADVLEEEDEVDLDEIYGTGGRVSLSVFRKYQASIKTLVKPMTISATAIDPNTGSSGVIARSVSINPALKNVFNKDLLDKIVIDQKVENTLKGKNKRQFKGRTYLNPLNQLDWDDEPTIYQAASIAHGHLLQFKQEWIPDGYSIGDILYSLPLAPGQKKQIAVLDWERRESAANSQQLDYQEVLNNSLVRDRDVNEVISATLNENIKANSNASTGGIGFGLGSSVMGIIPGVGTFGSLLGISGGKSSSGSSASQNAHRDSTASSLQSITDRTLQASGLVRSQRSTVIQTVSQGERVEATAESVANYNHCHALTIQYFEVLRHFNIQTRLAGVQECLFVPLQITPFNLDKCLRWRSTLEKRLFKRNLLKGFDAITRILHEKENADNYYDSIGFPKKNYAEQALIFFTGEIYLEFTFFNTEDGKLNSDLERFFKIFGIPLDDFRDRYLKNDELAEIVGPRSIEYLLNAITFQTDKGVDLKFDLTLLTRFRQNARMHISIRQTAGTPRTIAREQIEAIKIKLDKSKINQAEVAHFEAFQNKYMKIKVSSGSLRYRTENIAGSLFNGRIDNDLFSDNDGVYIPSILTADELRNPRGEDIDAANNLLHHLNENLEYYHKSIWFEMTPERRYMLLDGIIAPGKANGRSVASVVENKLIGIAGNSLIMPVAPGNQLDPTIDETFDMFAQYYKEDNDPIRISLPTKGVYAEAVIGKCNSCEEKDESRFWRWEESPIPDSPNTQILPLNTDTRRADPGNLQPKDFPAPVVSIQNAPNLPDPTGVQGMLQLIGKGDAFRDLTGLNQNQLNALATFQKTMDTAQSFGKEAAELAKSAAAMKMVEDAKKSGTISNEQAKQKGGAILDKVQGDPNANKLMESMKLLDQLEKEGKISADNSKDAKSNLIKNFLDSSNAKTSMSNDEISKLMEKVKGTNTELKVQRSDGEILQVKDGGTGKSTKKIDFTVPGFVQSLQQPSGLSCWATVATILLSWRDEVSYSIQAAMDIAGTKWRNKFDNNQVLKFSEHDEFATDAGFAFDHPQSYTIDAILDLLKSHGPFVAITDEDPTGNNFTHARVISGIKGDGTDDKTFLIINDPADGRVYFESVGDFRSKYEEAAGRPEIQVFYNK